MFNKKSVLVTGGTGTFGKKFVTHLLKKYKCKKIVIFSRDELKQFEMQNDQFFKTCKNIRFFLGDVRDPERLKIAMYGMDYIVHAAALKQVPAAEYNPTEFIKTNIYGAENVINAAILNNVSKVIALSTDKAVQPVNLYGATKLASDKLFIAANNMYGDKKTKFSVTRYGNVLASRGSVVPFFKDLIDNDNKFLPITDKEMTRFFITKNQAVEFVIDNMERMRGGEIFIPKLPSIRIEDLARSMSSKLKIKYIGKRPGEKIHEVMCPVEEAYLTVEYKKHFVIFSHTDDLKSNGKLTDKKNEKGKPVDISFEYSSGTNKDFLSISEIKKLNKDN